MKRTKRLRAGAGACGVSAPDSIDQLAYTLYRQTYPAPAGVRPPCLAELQRTSQWCAEVAARWGACVDAVRALVATEIRPYEERP